MKYTVFVYYNGPDSKGYHKCDTVTEIENYVRTFVNDSDYIGHQVYNNETKNPWYYVGNICDKQGYLLERFK